MLDFDLVLSKFKRKCDGSTMLVYGINRIRLFRIGHPVKMLPCSNSETSLKDNWLILPEPPNTP